MQELTVAGGTSLSALSIGLTVFANASFSLPPCAVLFRNSSTFVSSIMRSMPCSFLRSGRLKSKETISQNGNHVSRASLQVGMQNPRLANVKTTKGTHIHIKHTLILTYIHTNTHTYKHTYIQTYMYVYICVYGVCICEGVLARIQVSDC